MCGKGFELECRFEDLEYPVDGYTPIGFVDPEDMPQSNIATTRGKRPTQSSEL